MGATNFIHWEPEHFDYVNMNTCKEANWAGVTGFCLVYAYVYVKLAIKSSLSAQTPNQGE